MYYSIKFIDIIRYFAESLCHAIGCAFVIKVIAHASLVVVIVDNFVGCGEISYTALACLRARARAEIHEPFTSISFAREYCSLVGALDSIIVFGKFEV